MKKRYNHNQSEGVTSLRILPDKIPDVLSSEKVRQTLNAIKVHQTELMMQNEELSTIKVQLEKERAHFFNLYNLAPVGYCTLSGNGMIIEANLTASIMLGADMDTLVRQPVSKFILREDHEIYHLYQKQLFEIDQTKRCELRMVKSDGTVFWVNLTATTTQDPNNDIVCRIVINNITDRKQREVALQKAHDHLARRVASRREELWKYNLLASE